MVRPPPSLPIFIRLPVADHKPYETVSFAPEVALSERHELFLQKLQQCSVVFDFNDASTEMAGKQIKAATLQELLDWITSQRNVITEVVYPEVVAMVSYCVSPALGVTTKLTRGVDI